MIGIIWTENIEAGNKKLEQMIEDYSQTKINMTSYMHSKYGSIVSFENGDRWRVVLPSDRRRGERCNIAYIDRTIDKKTVDEVIFPSLIRYPYTAYKYIALSPEIEDN